MWPMGEVATWQVGDLLSEALVEDRKGVTGSGGSWTNEALGAVTKLSHSMMMKFKPDQRPQLWSTEVRKYRKLSCFSSQNQHGYG